MAIVYISSDAAELNRLDGTPAGLTSTELGYADGVTSAIQTQIDGKLANQTIGIADDNLVEIDSSSVATNDYARFTANGLQGLSTSEVKAHLNLEIGTDIPPINNAIFTGTITIGSAGISEAELEILDGAILSTTELNYVDGVTSAIQTQLGTKLTTSDLITSATFTPSGWGGFSSDPTGDMRYQIIGDGTHKYVFITDDSGAAMVGTSDTTGFTWGGIPVAARPDTPVSSMSFPSTNAGYVGQMNAIAQIATDGTVTMAAQPLSGSPSGPWWQNAGWTNSGDKGFPAGYVIMYPLVITS